jgi:hypothetical protein
VTHTWDGQPAADIDAAWDAMLAAAWCEGRDAAIAVARARATDLRNHDRSRLEAGLITQQMHALTPPPDLAAALAEHTRRAVEAEREAIAAWLDSRREIYEDRALRKSGKGDEADMMAAACYETASNFVRARSAP